MKPYALIKPYFRERRRFIVIGMISLIIVDILQLIIPRVIKRAVDDLTLLDAGTADLAGYALSIVAIALLIGFFRFIWRHCLLGTSRRVEEGLRNRLFHHLQTLSAPYFDRARSGDLMAHATNDIQQVRMAAGMGLVALNDAVFLGLAAIGFMAYIDVRLTLLVLIPMPLIVFGTRFFSRRMHRRYRRVQAAFAGLTESIRERFAGIRVIKAYHWEPNEIQTIRRDSETYVRENLDLVKITGAFFPMMALLTNLSMAIVVYFGGRQTIFGTITPGDFVAFISYLGLLTWPMMALGWVTNLIQRGRASLDRLAEIFQTRPSIVQPDRPRRLNRFQGRLTFENVDFAYRPHQPALSTLNLCIEPRTTLGIVGPPGSGKSTLLQLIPRLYDVEAGRIRLDGVNLSELDLSELRSRIAVVPQEPFLFAGTIRDNITLGSSDVSQDRLEAVVAQAALTDTIAALPRGYETVVGEKGVILSGGQKQRVALARGLLIPGSILLLDDPISQVDMETGRRIIEGLQPVIDSRTTLIVSHRISALRNADRIITMIDGRIVEEGSHEELIGMHGYYARSYHLQEIEEDLYAN
jgi:ATP-binding cassette subfamily B protein